jgi:hypothetical protein
MPIPANEIKTVEMIFYGSIASGGSDEVATQTVFQFTRAAFTVPPTKAAIATAQAYSGTGVNLVSRWLQAVNAAYTLNNMTLRWVDDALDPPTTFSIGQIGLVTGDRLPSETTAYLLLKTPLKGRSYKGAKFVGPLSESDIGDDVLLSGALTKLSNLSTAMLSFTDATPNTWNLVVMPRGAPNQFTENPTTVETFGVTQILTRQTVGYMKNRKVRSIY